MKHDEPEGAYKVRVDFFSGMDRLVDTHGARWRGRDAVTSRLRRPGLAGLVVRDELAVATPYGSG